MEATQACWPFLLGKVHFPVWQLECPVGTNAELSISDFYLCTFFSSGQPGLPGHYSPEPSTMTLSRRHQHTVC